MAKTSHGTNDVASRGKASPVAAAVQGESESESVDVGALRRLRVSVPQDDAIAGAWLDAQHSVSTSLRLLIHDAVHRLGSGDVFQHVVITLDEDRS